MTDPKPQVDPRKPCTVCGETGHTAGYHDSSEPAGYHDSGIKSGTNDK